MTALSAVNALPGWSDIDDMLDKLSFGDDERAEMEMLVTLLVLQGMDIGEKRALDRLNVLIAELREAVAETRRELAFISQVPKISSTVDEQ